MNGCIDNLAPSYIRDLCEKTRTPYDTKDNLKVIKRKFNSVTYGYNTFIYYGAKVGNELPAQVKCLTNLHNFKDKFRCLLKINN